MFAFDLVKFVSGLPRLGSIESKEQSLHLYTLRRSNGVMSERGSACTRFRSVTSVVAQRLLITTKLFRLEPVPRAGSSGQPGPNFATLEAG